MPLAQTSNRNEKNINIMTAGKVHVEKNEEYWKVNVK